MRTKLFTSQPDPGRRFILHPASNGSGLPLLNRWPFHRSRRAIGLVSSARPSLRPSSGPRIPPPARPRPSFEIRRVAPVVLHVFPFLSGGGQSARLRYFCTLLCFSYPLYATRYPLCAIRTTKTIRYPFPLHAHQQPSIYPS